MRRIVFGLSILVALAPAARAKRPTIAPDVLVDFGMGTRDLSSVLFQGDGRPEGFSDKVGVAATGAALGLRDTTLYHVDMHFLVSPLPHLAIGPYVGYLWGSPSPTRAELPAPMLTAGDRVFSSIQLGDVVSGVDLGVEAELVGGIGPLEVRLGAVGGYRSLAVALTNFEEVPCGKGGRCDPTIGADWGYLEPRASAGIFLGGGFTVGGWVGYQVLPDRAFEGGVYLGFSGSGALLRS